MLCGIWCLFVFCVIFFFFKQKTAYEMRISDWSSDVCSSDLLNIVLSNDDGFEAANIRALYTELKAAGHDVVLSGPAQNNSGKGGALDFLVPMKPLGKSTRFGTVKAGAPGVGVDPKDPDIFYVDGTPEIGRAHV